MSRDEKSKFSIFKVADGIIDKLAENLARKGYVNVECNNPHQTLFISRGEPGLPKWVSFLESISDSDQIRELTKITPAFILLYSIEKTCYAITGGGGHCHIKRYVDENFGLDTISKIIEPDKIKVIRQKALTGRVEELERVFKESYNYDFDTSNWGKLTKEIIGKLNKSLFNELFGIAGGKSATVKLAAKSSLWMSKSVSSEELDEIIRKLHEIQNKQPRFYLFKGYIQIQNKMLINSLDNRILENLNDEFERFLNQQRTYIESTIHLSYGDAKEFLLCDQYSLALPNPKDQIRVDTLDLPTVFSLFHQKVFPEIKRHHLVQTKIIGQDSDGEERDVRGSLKKFLYAEVTFQDEKYYFVDGRWYQLTEDFRREIDVMVEKIIKESDNKFSLPLWSGGLISKNEPEYITEICADNRFINMHNQHIPLRNGRAELCDVISLKSGVHLVFIKRGTGSGLRELFAQARFSMEFFKNDTQFRDKAFSKIQEKNRGRKIHKAALDKSSVVLAINDKSINRNHKPLENKLTTLAKLDLIHCVNNLKELGIEHVIIHEIKYDRPVKRQQTRRLVMN